MLTMMRPLSNNAGKDVEIAGGEGKDGETSRSLEYISRRNESHMWCTNVVGTGSNTVAQRRVRFQIQLVREEGTSPLKGDDSVEKSPGQQMRTTLLTDRERNLARDGFR
ncbi:hypothetical protein RIF29_30359 [Crotalaria pallida]|uniref:Uncharacterized protein n=1 Tax=Crotalaria pallida TaxID=3830 RepID=A0AAN9EIF1_CROPI